MIDINIPIPTPYMLTTFMQRFNRPVREFWVDGKGFDVALFIEQEMPDYDPSVGFYESIQAKFGPDAVDAMRLVLLHEVTHVLERMGAQLDIYIPERMKHDRPDQG